MSPFIGKQQPFPTPEEGLEKRDTALLASPSIERQQQRQQFSSLLRLPHELLLIIVDDIVVQRNSLMLYPKLRFEKKRHPSKSRPRSPLLSVLLVCRALYFAGIEAFYGRNTFRFEHSEHLRSLVSRMSLDQNGCIGAIELSVEWVKSRTKAQTWYPLHEIDYCLAWKDVVELLPKLQSIAIRSVTRFEQTEMLTWADTAAFEARMREEMGSDKSGLLNFVWPDSETTHR